MGVKSSQIKIVCLSDSPKITTGFGSVAKEIYHGFYEAGFHMTVVGGLDEEADTRGELRYQFVPVTSLQTDPIGHSTLVKVVTSVRPDVVWVLTDPGNLRILLNLMARHVAMRRDGRLPFPVVAYVPIEGRPLAEDFGLAFTMVQNGGGRVVVYCHSAVETIRAQFPHIHPIVAFHGSDHAPFQRYSEEDRHLLRHLVGFDKYFIVGAIGTNKRTKGHPVLIYAAHYLRDIGSDEGIKFYLHTEPDDPVLFGYPLRHLARYYGVADMFLWKPDPDMTRGGWNRGIERFNGTVQRIRELSRPSSPAERATLFGSYDFVARLNCLNMYLDVSEVEGWGLPQFEAMACGVPTVTVNDRGVRTEIHAQGSYVIEPLPEICWPTSHTGARLAMVDPRVVAEAILTVRTSEDLQKELSRRGQQVAQKYSWGCTRKIMKQAVQDCVGG
jgi:glycosyltransferase involved in cell wall biosynthesis